jgi:predicted TPR repeat methyltransferase
VWYHIGNLKEKLGHTAKAIAAHETALRLDPNHKDAAAARARLQ